VSQKKLGMAFNRIAHVFYVFDILNYPIIDDWVIGKFECIYLDKQIDSNNSFKFI